MSWMQHLKRGFALRGYWLDRKKCTQLSGIARERKCAEKDLGWRSALGQQRKVYLKTDDWRLSGAKQPVDSALHHRLSSASSGHPT